MTMTKARTPATLAPSAWVRVEIHVFEPLGREVRVDLRRGDVRVAEHLLQGAQVAPSGQQVGGEGVAEGVRAHLVLEPGRARVALDDLVEALARQAAAAVVDEQARFQPVADE